MNKTWKIVLSIAAIAAVAAGVACTIYYLLNKDEDKKPLAFFKSKFNDDGSVEAIDATSEAQEEDSPCDDAVCAVDMCMPY